MKPIELSLAQCGKVLWSYLWRGWILMFPPSIVLALAMAFFMPKPQAGMPMNPKEIMPILAVLYVAMVVIYIVTQSFAIRWMLKTKWSDFRLVPVAALPPTEEIREA